MEFIVHRKAARILAGTFMLALAGLAAVLLWPKLVISRPALQAEIAPDAAAAVEAVTAFYTLDYSESPEIWTARVCSHATELGCRAIKNIYGPAVQAVVEKNSIMTKSTVVPVEVVREEGNRRTWKLLVSLENPWPDLDSAENDIYVEVENMDGRWLLNRILFEQEVTR